MKNSPRPWKSLSAKDGFDPCIIDAKGNYVSMTGDDIRELITNCVNACAGMDDPVGEIERLKTMRKGLSRAGMIIDNAARKIKIDSHEHLVNTRPGTVTPPSWHELGILPPVGAVCEFSSNGHHNGFVWCKFHGKIINNEGLIIEFVSPTNRKFTIVDSFDPQFTKFRPIQTEKQKTIAAMIECFDDFFSDDGPKYNAGDVCEKIYDKFLSKKAE